MTEWEFRVNSIQWNESFDIIMPQTWQHTQAKKLWQIISVLLQSLPVSPHASSFQWWLIVTVMIIVNKQIFCTVHVELIVVYIWEFNLLYFQHWKDSNAHFHVNVCNYIEDKSDRGKRILNTLVTFGYTETFP